MPKLLTQEVIFSAENRPVFGWNGGRLHTGMVAVFDRNGGRLHVGIRRPGRPMASSGVGCGRGLAGWSSLPFSCSNHFSARAGFGTMPSRPGACDKRTLPCRFAHIITRVIIK